MEWTVNIRSKPINDFYKNYLREGDNILDIGCGNGHVAKNLEKKFKCKISGADILNYLEWDMSFFKIENDYKVPVREKQFDVALMTDVLHHCERDNQVKLIKEALRVSRKVLIFETKPTFTAKVLDKVLNKFHEGDMPVPLSHRTIRGWENLFKENKIILQETRVMKTPFYYPLKHIGFALSNE